jgi:Zn-finger nucleic acid-binding protein
VRLTETHYDALILDECRLCGGCWYDHGEIEIAAAQHPPKTKAARKKALPKKKTLECPRCGRALTKIWVRGKARVPVNGCIACGLWIRAGEMEKILGRRSKKPQWGAGLLENEKETAADTLIQAVVHIPGGMAR